MSVAPFVRVAQPTRVVFGSGSLARIGEEARGLGATRLLLLSTPGRGRLVERVAGLLGDAFAGGFAGARGHTPSEVTDEALDVARAVGADGLVAIGGGSATGLSKALALRLKLPQIALPTTYAGSEMTSVVGETIEGRKRLTNSPSVRPALVIYDVDLTTSLPAGTSAASGLNAIAHAVEALYAPGRSPLTALEAEKGIEALSWALPRIVDDPRDGAARDSALLGAWLCGSCLAQGGMALHHKLCHVLGGTFELPHAETHAAVLPHVVAFNAPAAPDAMRVLARALGADDPVAGLFDLATRIGAPTSLRALGLRREDLGKVADLVFAETYANPRPVERAPLLQLIEDAWNGVRPRSATVIAAGPEAG